METANADQERTSITTCQDSSWAVRVIKADVVDFSPGQPSPDSLPSEKLAAAAAHCLGPGADPFVLQYGPEQGALIFRQALAGFLTDQYGHGVEPSELVATAGVSHGLDMACRRFGTPGSTILVETPTYFLAGGIFEQCGLRAVPAATDAQGLCVAELELRLRGDPELRPSLLYVIPTHNNPRGTSMPLPRRQQLIRLAHLHGFYILADEVYQCLTFPGAPPPPPPLRHVERDMGLAEGRDGSRIISLSSFSKTMAAPGLRLGWIETSEALAAELSNDAVLRSGGSLSALAQGMMLSAMHLGLLQEQLAGQLTLLERNCGALCAALRELLPTCRFVQPQGGYFVWLELPEGVDAGRLLQLSRESFGVRFVPGPVCNGSPHCIRLAFSFYTPAELREGVRRLAAALEAYKVAMPQSSRALAD